VYYLNNYINNDTYGIVIEGTNWTKNNISIRSVWKDGKKTNEKWLVDGKLHGPDGPALRYWREDNVTIELWFINGMRHCTEGPAAIIYYRKNGGKSIEKWYVNGKLHRINGPAIIIKLIIKPMKNGILMINFKD